MKNIAEWFEYNQRFSMLLIISPIGFFTGLFCKEYELSLLCFILFMWVIIDIQNFLSEKKADECSQAVINEENTSEGRERESE